ncbi:MAG: glycosyltransferase family 4 protein [Candidatus Dojkabacteria bacterium]
MEANIFEPYLDLLPYMAAAFFVSLLLTPVIGYLATKYRFIDLPAKLRKRTDKTIDQRIHDEAKPRLGGLAVLIPFFLIAFAGSTLTSQVWGMLLGLGIIVIVGVLDDKYELSGGVQFAFQLLAAIIVVVSGVSITHVDVAGLSIDFNSFSRELNLGSFIYNFVFPADLITVGWIMIIVNALNWVCGIDALGEGITFIAALTTMILAVRVGSPEFAIFPALLVAGLLGFIPYNFPPSKIIGGTAGHTGYGFLLAVLAILSGAKITSGIILLSIPLVDMGWVLLNRMRDHKTVNIFKLFSISGRVHLHHRLMSLGFSGKQTLYIETSAMAVVSLIALYFGDFNTSLITLVLVIALLIIFFTIISLRTRNKPSTPKPPPSEPEPPVIDTGPTPEEKYAY